MKYILALLSLITILSTSCVSQKEIVYFQGMGLPNQDSAQYNIKIQDDDVLNIFLSTKNKELLEPFYNNMVLGMSKDLRSSSTIDTEDAADYRVERDSTIILPVLGVVKLGGLTTDEASKKIAQIVKDKGYIHDPIVRVKLNGFTVSVMGAVKHPGVYTVNGERATVLDALSQAGDLKASGKRTNVAILREYDKKRSVKKIDLTKREVINSPYYYLHQHDVVYVEDNGVSSASGSPFYNFIKSNQAIFGVGVSLVSLMTSLLVH